MQRSDTLSAQMKEFREMLAAERTEEIDFDRLIALLEVAAPVLAEAQESAESLASLRLDYEGRIAGMVKAMAAIDRSGRGYEDAIESLEVLPQLSGEKLVACYRRTSARFRDMFPTSYGPKSLSGIQAKRMDFSVFK